MNKCLNENISLLDVDELINEMVMKIPSGYSCASCQKHFTQLVNLKSHIEAKHIESIGVACIDVACASCQKHFTQLVNLKSHIEAKHIESILVVLVLLLQLLLQSVVLDILGGHLHRVCHLLIIHLGQAGSSPVLLGE